MTLFTVEKDKNFKMTTVCTQNEDQATHISPSVNVPTEPAGHTGSQTIKRSGEILPLTSLRFFAAFHVVLFHVWGTFIPSLPSPRYWNDFINLGYVGVSMFFILSGYILTVVYVQNGTSVAFSRPKFYIARFVRIYPLYALSLLAYTPFELGNLGTHTLPYRIIKFAGLTVTNFGMIQAWHPTLGGAWNVPAWSVSAEAFFYLVFPAIGLAIATRIKRPLRIGLILWLASIATSVVLSKAFPDVKHNHFAVARCNPLLRLPEFLIGVCAAKWHPRIVPKSLSWMSVLIYLGLIPLIAPLPELVVSNGLLAPIFVALIVGLGTLNGHFERLLSSPVLVTLGHASYSLYLLHFPVLFWFSYLLQAPKTRTLTGPSIFPVGLEKLTAYLVITVITSILSYNLVEKPARQYLLKRLHASPRALAKLV